MSEESDRRPHTGPGRTAKSRRAGHAESILEDRLGDLEYPIRSEEIPAEYGNEPIDFPNETESFGSVFDRFAGEQYDSPAEVREAVYGEITGEAGDHHEANPERESSTSTRRSRCRSARAGATRSKGPGRSAASDDPASSLDCESRTDLRQRRLSSHMDYESSLDRAMDDVPDIGGDEQRLQIPDAQMQKDGAFTRFTNLDEIADVLSREDEHLHRFVQREMGTAGNSRTDVGGTTGRSPSQTSTRRSTPTSTNTSSVRSVGCPTPVSFARTERRCFAVTPVVRSDR